MPRTTRNLHTNRSNRSCTLSFVVRVVSLFEWSESRVKGKRLVALDRRPTLPPGDNLVFQGGSAASGVSTVEVHVTPASGAAPAGH